jgi:hypothetical protein
MAMSGIELENFEGNDVILQVHPRSVSKMRGLKNRNIELLGEKFNLKSVDIVPTASLGEDQLKVSARA